jgi:hypothetical protein
MLAVFAVCAALMFARRLPALLAVPLMALALAVLAGAGWAGVASVLVDGTVRLAPVFAYVIFGALLSRVTMATGIAETIIAYAAEFGGDRPAVLALALCAAVAALFTSLYGLGAIVMVGSIVLPIMMTVGVPRRTAATLFLLAYALGFIFNVSQWGFYTRTFGVARATMQPYALALAAIDLVALAAFAVVRFRATRGYATWALESDDPPARKRVPAAALITPLLPIVLYFAAGLDPVSAFALAALYGVLATKAREAVPVLTAAAIRGVEDVAPAILLFMGIGMLLVATGLPSVKAALVPVVTALAPKNAFAYVVLFGLLSPLALYRGPLNPFGVGIAVYTVMAGLGVLPPVLLVAAVMAVVQVQNVCDPTNTQNVWVANFTGVRVDEITRLTLPFQVAVATVAALVAIVFAPALFGLPGLPAAQPAAAASLPSGLFAPASSANAIGVAAADDPASAAAAGAIEAQIAGGWSGYRAVRLARIPAPSACLTTPYAALLVVRVTTYGGGGGEAPVTDAGLELDDCAGWPVEEWHEQRPRRATAGELGLATLFRVRTWMTFRPALANELFTRGLAYDPASGPAYFYSLFKTSDGQMRAFVRPGGPAYDAGLRTNDIVQKLDGKYWWEYGTFQTQQRAYDGQPHTFVVTRGNDEVTVALGAPFDGRAAAP